MIKMPPDGRQVIGQQIEGVVHTLDQFVTDYLNMLSLADKPLGEAKVRAALAPYPVLKKILEL